MSLNVFKYISATVQLYASYVDVTYSEILRDLKPMTNQLTTLHSSGTVRGVIVTVKGSSSATDAAASDMYDFGSRYFAPWVGINEDPVTGLCNNPANTDIMLRKLRQQAELSSK